MKWLGILTLVFLAGCGSLDTGSDNLLGAKNINEDAAAQARFAALARAGRPALVVSVEDRGAIAALMLTAQNGDVSTWVSVDNTTLSTRGGFVIATRGLGGDLMSADIAQTRQRIAGGSSGDAVRVHRYLDGEDQIIARSFVCDIRVRGPRSISIGDRRFATRLLQERCQGSDISFQNLYWFSQSSGEMLQSRQWVGPAVGSLAIRRILP
ncbi:MAG: YjbF family lipoprotein [Halocynthiibacter sp.]